MKIKISIVIFTKNEERNIYDCIMSVKDFSEVVVVDSGSVDDTRVIAESMGVRFIDFDWNGKYPKKRQWTLDNVEFNNSWILFLDADERLTYSLTQELADFIENYSTSFSAGSIALNYFFAGSELKFGQKPRKTVLLKVGSAAYPEINDLNSRGMGELEGHYQPSIDGKIRKFRTKIIHNDLDPVSTWMTRHVGYANWEAHLILNKEARFQVNKSKGVLGSYVHQLPLKPLAFFFYSYILKFGFLDGKAGFDYAFAKSWYYWLSNLIAREVEGHES